jgi:hypothetical protein
MRKHRTILLATALLFMGASCGSNTINQSSQQTKDTQQLAVEPQLENFPTEIPLYPKSKVISSGYHGAFGSNAKLETIDKGSVVIAWYKAELIKQGWFISTEENVSGDEVLIARTKRGATMLITTIINSYDKTTISIRFAPQPSRG